MNYNIIFILTLFWGVLVSVQAQTPTEEAARAELVRRGYDADRFNQEMLKKGVDPTRIDMNNPSDVARARKAAEEVAAMLDAEKQTSAATQKTDSPQNTSSDNKTVESTDEAGKIRKQ